MPTTNLNRKLLDLKRWEVCAPAPTSTAAGSFIVSSRLGKPLQLYVRSNSEQYIYDPTEDSWLTLPSGALTVGAGSSGTCVVARSVLFQVSTATTTFISAIYGNQPVMNVEGCLVLFTSGANAGLSRPISTTSIKGSSTEITLSTAFPTAPSGSDTFTILYPKFIIASSGSTSFKAYDYITNTWSTLSGTMASAPATDSRLVATPSVVDGEHITFATGTATGGSSSTLIDGSKTWTTNQHVGKQVRITSGTGAGQVGVVSSNNATIITIAGIFATAPDNTSGYAIEGCDDYVYFLNGNASTALLRYSISAGSFSTMLSRGGNANAGITGHWVHSSGDATIDGDRIYSFRGGSTTTLDYYTISANTWANAIAYSPASTSFTTGTKSVLRGKYIYICYNGSNYWVRLDVTKPALEGFSYMHVLQGAAVVGDTAFDATYTDGVTEIPYVYMLLNTSNQLHRMMII